MDDVYQKIEGAKPCPFCGFGGIYTERYETPVGERWRAICGNCAATYDDGCTQTRARVINLWNTREGKIDG